MSTSIITKCSVTQSVHEKTLAGSDRNSRVVLRSRQVTVFTRNDIINETRRRALSNCERVRELTIVMLVEPEGRHGLTNRLHVSRRDTRMNGKVG